MTASRLAQSSCQLSNDEPPSSSKIHNKFSCSQNNAYNPGLRQILGYYYALIMINFLSSSVLIPSI
eukprot:6204945-Pleurochrysis_carterae.AAC.1